MNLAMFKALKKLPIYLENRLLVNFQSIMLMVSCIPGLKSATLLPPYGVLLGTQGETVPQVDPGTLKDQ